MMPALTLPVLQPLDKPLSYFLSRFIAFPSPLPPPSFTLPTSYHASKHLFFRETPLRCLRVKTPPTLSFSAPEHPLCDGRSGHTVCVSETRRAPLRHRERVPQSAAQDGIPVRVAVSPEGTVERQRSPVAISVPLDRRNLQAKKKWL